MLKLLFIILLTFGYSQPEIEWSQIFGGWTADFAHSVQQTTDGGYIIGGYTRSFGNGNSDVWLIKTDSDGQEQWNQTFGGTNNDTGRFVQQTLDGGYIIAGRTESFNNGGFNNGGSDVWLIKTDPNGFEEWNQMFGGISTDFGWSVQQTSDGGYIIVGTTFSFGNGSYDAWLIKTDANGQEEWNQTFGGSDYEYGNSVQQTLDNGYIIVGSTRSFGNGGVSDVWLVKTNANGQEEWNQTFGGSSDDIGYFVQQTVDTGYIIVGDTGSFSNGFFDVWLIKTDIDGEEEWNQTFGGGDYEQGSSVQQTLDGGYIITGRTESFSDGVFSALWLIKTDADGEEEWNQTFGDGSTDDRGRSIQQSLDGGYIIAGYTQAYGNGGSVDALLIKIECENHPNCEEEILGDFNNDGLLNVVDIVILVDIILNNNSDNPSFDINEDGLVNIVDIVLLVDLILN